MTYVLSDDTHLCIRLAQPDDAQIIIEYLNTISLQTDQLSFSGYQFGMTVEQERAYLERIANNATRDRIVTGWIHNELVSVANIEVKKAPRHQHIAEINISVLPMYHGMGIGSRMFAHTIQVAKELGVEVFTLWVRADNRPGLALYHKYGFRVVGTLPCGDRHGNIYHDLYLMSAWL